MRLFIAFSILAFSFSSLAANHVEPKKPPKQKTSYADSVSKVRITIEKIELLLTANKVTTDE